MSNNKYCVSYPGKFTALGNGQEASANMVTIGRNKAETCGEAQAEKAWMSVSTGLSSAKTQVSCGGRGSTGAHSAGCVTLSG